MKRIAGITHSRQVRTNDEGSLRGDRQIRADPSGAGADRSLKDSFLTVLMGHFRIESGSGETG